MEASKQLIQERIARLLITRQDYEDALQAILMGPATPMVGTREQHLEAAEMDRMWKITYDMRLAECDAEIDKLAFEYQALLRIEIEAGLKLGKKTKPKTGGGL
jgi:hypothetical protein